MDWVSIRWFLLKAWLPFNIFFEILNTNCNRITELSLDLNQSVFTLLAAVLLLPRHSPCPWDVGWAILLQFVWRIFSWKYFSSCLGPFNSPMFSHQTSPRTSNSKALQFNELAPDEFYSGDVFQFTITGWLTAASDFWLSWTGIIAGNK